MMLQAPQLDTTLHFLGELSQNNQKSWFEAHRANYETARTEFERFLDELIAEFRASDHLQGLKAKDCLARIYRDVRFTKDKSPYKTNFGAMIAPGGWRATALGYYIHIEPQGRSMVAGGWYDPTPEQLNRFRQAVDEDAQPFKEITVSKEFIQAFGKVSGDRLKTAPKGYDRTHPEIELLQLRQVTVIHLFSDSEILSPDLINQVVACCRAMKPFLNYLTELQ